MSDELMQAVLPDKPVRRRRWWLLWLLPALVIGVSLLRVAWLFRPGDARGAIEIGPETTVVTTPLTPDGFVDFAAAMNERAGKGVTPENNAVVLLIQAFGPAEIPAGQRERYFERLGIPPLPESGAYLVDDRQFVEGRVDESKFAEQFYRLEDDVEIANQRPWTADEFPMVAAFIAANEEPLKLVVAASQRTRYFAPIANPDADLMSTSLFVEQRGRWGARLLRLRGMQRLGQGDLPGAWDDMLACHKLARLMGESPHTIGVLVSYALENIASEGGNALIRSDALTTAQARQCLADLDALRPIATSADAADFGERLTVIDTYCRIAQGRIAGHDSIEYSVSQSRLRRAFDWNLMLRLTNQQIDRSVALMRLPDPRERAARFDELEQELNSSRVTLEAGVSAFVGFNEPISREVSAIMNGLLGAPFRQYRNGEMRTAATLALTRIGFALAVHQRENGAYPQTLAELAPAILAEVPGDACSGEEFIYQPADDGFLLYSVGINMKDDGGAGYDDEPRGDDLVLRVGIE